MTLHADKRGTHRKILQLALSLGARDPGRTLRSKQVPCAAGWQQHSFRSCPARGFTAFGHGTRLACCAAAAPLARGRQLG